VGTGGVPTVGRAATRARTRRTKPHATSARSSPRVQRSDPCRRLRGRRPHRDALTTQIRRTGPGLARPRRLRHESRPGVGPIGFRDQTSRKGARGDGWNAPDCVPPCGSRPQGRIAHVLRDRHGKVPIGILASPNLSGLVRASRARADWPFGLVVFLGFSLTRRIDPRHDRCVPVWPMSSPMAAASAVRSATRSSLIA